MRNATRHLPQGTQALLLHHRELRLAQVVVGSLQVAVDPRLIHGQCNMLAQLAQKLAIAAAEAVGLRAGREQHAKYLLLALQWCADE
jgi:hypothetical protein